MRRALPLALLLAGCGHVQSTPVPVACVAREDIPAEPLPIRDKLTGNAAVDAPMLAIAALEWKATAVKALALLKGCAD